MRTVKKLTLKVALGFAVIGYLVAIGLYLAPGRWHLSSALVFGLCPPAFLTITVDPSFASVAILLAPLNALLYGTIGVIMGLIVGSAANQKGENSGRV